MELYDTTGTAEFDVSDSRIRPYETGFWVDITPSRLTKYLQHVIIHRFRTNISRKCRYHVYAGDLLVYSSVHFPNRWNKLLRGPAGLIGDLIYYQNIRIEFKVKAEIAAIIESMTQ